MEKIEYEKEEENIAQARSYFGSYRELLEHLLEQEELIQGDDGGNYPRRALPGDVAELGVASCAASAVHNIIEALLDIEQRLDPIDAQHAEDLLLNSLSSLWFFEGAEQHSNTLLRGFRYDERRAAARIRDRRHTGYEGR